MATNPEILWKPTAERVASSQLSEFARLAEQRFGREFDSYDELYQWSISDSEDFWGLVAEFTGLISSETDGKVATHLDQFPGTQWFPNTRLNFAENFLQYRDDRVALVSLLENDQRRTLSYSDLYKHVAVLAAAFRAAGLGPGDRVAALMPNIPETVIAMLATTSLGAIWSSCSPDFGVEGACDRFGQIAPKLFFTTEGYLYNGKEIDCLGKAAKILERLDGVQASIVVPLLSQNVGLKQSGLSDATLYADFVLEFDGESEIEFAHLPFDHPVYINYSSGTTGTPKCIVHGAGGTLLQHKKEMMLHTDLRREDVLFYFTTCGWMMWNWLVSGLTCGATVVLYDGSPFAKNGSVLLDAIDDEGITVFGTSARYLTSLENEGLKPAATHSLKTMRSILSTGSPLSKNGFEFVYRDFKADVALASICGGTDIISCFILGNPNLAVINGEIQCRGLGMAVEFWDDEGRAVMDEKGQLVCIKPFPSTPVGFWNDPDQIKFRAAYFSEYPNIWVHGDYGELTSNGGVIVHGRSDAVLNPGGVRIGTAEIYRHLDQMPEVADAVVIGQQWQGDERVVLFVQLQVGLSLDEELTKRIKQQIRQNATPRHVPALIISVSDIPRTISGKTVELAVKNVVHAMPVKNVDALANPEALLLFKDLPELS